MVEENLLEMLPTATSLKMLSLFTFGFLGLGVLILLLLMFFCIGIQNDTNFVFISLVASLGIGANLEGHYVTSPQKKKPRSRPTKAQLRADKDRRLDNLENELLTLLLLKIVDKELKSFLNKEKQVLERTCEKPVTPSAKKCMLPEVDAPRKLQPDEVSKEPKDLEASYEITCTSSTSLEPTCTDFPSPVEAKEVIICGECGEELAPLSLSSPIQEDIISFSTHPELPALDEMMKPACSQLSSDTSFPLPCSSDTESKNSSSSEEASASFEVISWCQKSSSSDDSNLSFELVSSSDEM